MSTEPNSNQPNHSVQALPARRSPLWKLAGFVALLVVGGYLAWLIGLRPAEASPEVQAAEIRTAAVTQGPLEKTIRVGGVTSSIVFANVRAPVQRGPERRSLILLELMASGERVKKGDVVGEIDGQGLKDHIEDVQATVNTSIADIKKRRAEQEVDWNNLKQSILVAGADSEKWEHEARASEVRTVTDREILKLGVEESSVAFEQQQKDLAFKEQVHDAEIKILEVTTARHKRHVDRHAFDLERYTITAPMDGMVVRQQIFRNGEFGMVEVGDRLWPGLLFLKIMDTANMQIEANINQAESNLFKIGMEARIGMDAFPGVELKGEVYSIGALAKSARGSTYVRQIPVRVKIEGSHPKLIPDLSAYADVVIEKLDAAVQVPLGAIFEEAGQDYVYVRQGDSFDKRPVELGLRNQTHAAVLSGLEGGEDVALDEPVAPSET